MYHSIPMPITTSPALPAANFTHFLLRAALLTALLSVALITAVAPARAQEPRVITFEQAVRVALEQNVTVRRAANDVELQSRQVFQERMNFLPNLNFSSGGSRGSGFAQDQAGRNIAYSTTNYNGTVSSNINLFNGFADVASLDQARFTREASESSYDRTRQEVVFNVVNTFLSLIDAQEQIRIQEENLESQNQQLAQIDEFVRVGSRPISDLYQQQAEVAQTELQLLNAERTAQLTQTRLIQVLQLDPFGAYRFEAPDLAEVPIQPTEYDLTNLLQTAFAQRADLRAQEARIAASEQGIRIARSAYWPTLGFGGSLRSNFNPEGERTFFDQVDQNRGTSLGFNFSIPIFNRFNRGTNVQRAEVLHRNASLDLENIRQQVALQVRQAYLDYLTSEKQVEVAQKQSRAAELALEAAQERYNVGAATLVELTQANARYVQAASNSARARFEFLFQGKLIEYYIGQLNPSQPLVP
jgi:outer membrane protein